MRDLDEFTLGYVACALWSSTDEHGDPLDDDNGIGDVARETLGAMAEDCRRFQAANADLLAQAGDDGRNGHDFWLTRNGHGAGFWDRGYGEAGERLSEAARAWGSRDLHVGDDDMIHQA